MTRRSLFALPFLAAITRGDAASEIWALFAKMAESLAADNIDGFLSPVDPKMPGFDRLATNIKAIIEQAETRSIIDKVSDEGDDHARTVQLNWLLQMKQRGGADDRAENRLQVVTFRLARQGKRWRVVGIEPLDFFKPPVFT